MISRREREIYCGIIASNVEAQKRRTGISKRRLAKKIVQCLVFTKLVYIVTAHSFKLTAEAEQKPFNRVI